MTDLKIVFDERVWEKALAEVAPGGSFCAVRLLTLLEGEDESQVEDAVQALADRRIQLDISALPPASATGACAERLLQEQKLVQQGKLPDGLPENDPLRLYFEEVAATPAAGDPQVLASQLAAGDKTVVDMLLNLMLSRVIAAAEGYVGKGVLLSDLIQEASLGLWQSLQSYEAGDFEAHCDWWIHHYLTSAVMLQARENGVGQKLRQALEDYRSVDEKLLSELGRNPTIEEMAHALHMTVQETAILGEMLQNARSLQQIKMPEPEQLPQEEEQAVEDTAYFRMRQRIADLLSGVSQLDAELLTLRYGLEGKLPMSSGQVAAQLGISEEEVNAREAAALRQLRQQNV